MFKMTSCYHVFNILLSIKQRDLFCHGLLISLDICIYSTTGLFLPPTATPLDLCRTLSGTCTVTGTPFYLKHSPSDLMPLSTSEPTQRLVLETIDLVGN